MIRLDDLSQINAYATYMPQMNESRETLKADVASAGDELSLKIEKTLVDLVFGLVKEAHDIPSRVKALAEVHKLRDRRHRLAMDLEKLKLDQRRMDVLETEQRRRRHELEIKLQQAEARQQQAQTTRSMAGWKARTETMLQAGTTSPEIAEEGTEKDTTVHETAAFETATKATATRVPAVNDPGASVQVPTAASKTETAKLAGAPTAGATTAGATTAGVATSVPTHAPVAAPTPAVGNEKELRRARRRARKADKIAARELKRREQIAARAALSGTQPTKTT